MNLKFTPEDGSVTVSAEINGDGDLEVSVKDTVAAAFGQGTTFVLVLPGLDFDHGRARSIPALGANRGSS
jgi:hypothetical protein